MTPPINARVSTQYPVFMAIYLNPLRSKRAFTPKTGRTKNKPDRTPCTAPCLNVRKLLPYFAINPLINLPTSDVGSEIPGSFIKIEFRCHWWITIKLSWIASRTLSSSETPKIVPMFAPLIISSVIPLAFIHAFPSTLGLYHTKPVNKGISAAIIIAIQLKLIRFVLMNIVRR